MDILGGKPLTNCPYASSTLPPSSAVQSAGFAIHNPAISLTYLTLAITLFAFTVSIFRNYNSLVIFNTKITHKSTKNAEFAVMFLLSSLSFAIDFMRYAISDLAHALPAANHEQHWIVGPAVIDSWMLLTSCVLRVIATYLLTLGFLMQIKHRTKSAAFKVPSVNETRDSVAAIAIPRGVYMPTPEEDIVARSMSPIRILHTGRENLGNNKTKAENNGGETEPLLTRIQPSLHNLDIEAAANLSNTNRNAPLTTETMRIDSQFMERDSNFLNSLTINLPFLTTAICFIQRNLKILATSTLVFRLIVLFSTLDASRLNDESFAEVGALLENSFPVLDTIASLMQYFIVVFAAVFIICGEEEPVLVAGSDVLVYQGPTSRTKMLFAVGTLLYLVWVVEVSVLHRVLGLSNTDDVCIVPPYWWIRVGGDSLRLGGVYMKSGEHGWASSMDMVQWIAALSFVVFYIAVRKEFKRTEGEWMAVRIREVQTTFDFRRY